jgi:hypothetical protein
MTQPTPFQRRMDTFLSDLAGVLGAQVEMQKVGEKELAMRYRLPNLDCEVWIYEDGANILSVKRDDRYEIVDYDSIEDLETVLKEDLRRALARSSETT